MSANSVNDLLQDYFDELLSEAPGTAEPAVSQTPAASGREAVQVAAPLDVLDSNVRRDQLQQLLYSARASLTQHMSEPEASGQAHAEATAAPEPAALEPKAPITHEMPADLLQPVAEPSSVLDQALQWHSNGRPVWAQESFEVLLFTVSGLTLAVPLIALGQIQPLTDELTPLFGQADWFMGLQPTPSGKVRTVNTAKFVMPERYDPAFVESAQYVVSISGVPWGLAVDNVEQPMRLNPDDVKWRSSRSKRPWLAGTVKEHMCALLDIPMMAKLLTDADRNSRK